MPYTLEDFQRDSTRSLLDSLTPKEVLTYYKPERLLSGLTIEERLAGLSAQELEWLSKRLQSEPRNGESAPDDA